jgi:hypothetical protein
MPICVIGHYQEAYCSYKSQNWFLAGMQENFSHECEWAFGCQFFAGAPYYMDKWHI